LKLRRETGPVVSDFTVGQNLFTRVVGSLLVGHAAASPLVVEVVSGVEPAVLVLLTREHAAAYAVWLFGQWVDLAVVEADQQADGSVGVGLGLFAPVEVPGPAAAGPPFVPEALFAKIESARVVPEAVFAHYRRDPIRMHAEFLLLVVVVVVLFFK